MDKPIYTLKEWHKLLDKKLLTQLFEPTAILRDWERDRAILQKQLKALEDAN